MSPGDDERHPRGEGGASSSSSNTECKASRRQNRPAARRLDAALRLPGLEDGTRDPSVSWDACPAPGELVLEVGPRNTAWLQGSSKVIVPLLGALGARWQYGPDGWAFSRRYVDDVLAAADHERRLIRLRSVDR